MKLGEGYPAGEGVLAPQLAGELFGDADDGRRFQRQPAAFQPAGQGAGSGQQPIDTIEALIEHFAQAVVCRRGIEVVRRHAGLAQPVVRQINPVEAQIIVLAVLQMVDDLQGVAQSIGSRVARRCLAVQVEQISAHRRGRIAAIAGDQIVPIIGAQLGRIAFEGDDQIAAMLVGDAGLGEAVADAGGLDKGWVLVLAEQRPVHPFEPGDLVARFKIGIVGDVVDGAGKVVEARDMGPQPLGQEDRADGEVLIACFLA